MTPAEVFAKVRELNDSFAEVMNFYTGSERHLRYRELVEKARQECGEDGVRHLTTLMTFTGYRQVNIEKGGTMTDNSINNSGSMAGVAAGGSVWATNITATNQIIQNSGAMDTGVKTALKDVLDYVEKAKLDDDEKFDVTTMAGRIAKQMCGESKPDEGKVKSSFETIKTILGTATAVAGLYTALGKIFGWGAGAAAAAAGS